MLEINIREFRFPEDYQPACMLWENAGPGVRFGRSDQQEQILTKMNRDPDLFLVAEVNNTLVGTVIGGFDGRRGMIYHLAVRQDMRVNGIGGKLMNEVEMRLRAKGCLKSYLLVTQGNMNAIHFYEKHGWSHVTNALLYGKDLAE